MERRIRVYVVHFPDRPALQLQWEDPITGKKKTRSARTADEAEAKIKRGDLEADLNAGRFRDCGKLSWEKFREAFEAGHAAGLRPRSQDKYGEVLNVVERLINPGQVGAINERVLTSLVSGMREEGYAAITIRGHLVALRTALRWAAGQRLLAAVPTFPTVRVPQKKPQPVPSESFERLLGKAPDALWRAFLLAGWWAGLRISEGLELRWEESEEWPWVDFAQDRIAFPAAFVKAGVDQWVPLHPVLKVALLALPREHERVFPLRTVHGDLMPRSTVSHRVLRMAKRAGVKMSHHTLRKGFGCRLAKLLGKGGAAALHELMRHASLSTTLGYYASVDDAKAEVIGRLE